jgi:hypothetical protein
MAGREVWLRGMDSNHDSQIQSLESYQLDDPGAGSRTYPVYLRPFRLQTRTSLASFDSEQIVIPWRPDH